MTPTAMAKVIELWPLERLVPYSRNARTHSDEQVAQVAASIAEFGFNNPILVDTNAGISSIDAPVLSVCASVMLAIGAAAVIVPAMRACRIDPLRALRHE